MLLVTRKGSSELINRAKRLGNAGFGQNQQKTGCFLFSLFGNTFLFIYLFHLPRDRLRNLRRMTELPPACALPQQSQKTTIGAFSIFCFCKHTLLILVWFPLRRIKTSKRSKQLFLTYNPRFLCDSERDRKITAVKETSGSVPQHQTDPKWNSLILKVEAWERLFLSTKKVAQHTAGFNQVFTT